MTREELEERLYKMSSQELVLIMLVGFTVLQDKLGKKKTKVPENLRVIHWPYDSPRHKLRNNYGTQRTKDIHRGEDISTGGTRQEILAGLDGEVVYAKYKDQWYGNTICIKSKLPDGRDVWLVYAHCHEFLKQAGDKVERGKPIARTGGLVGTDNGAGNSKGRHVHFEVRVGANLRAKTVPPADYCDPNTLP